MKHQGRFIEHGERMKDKHLEDPNPAMLGLGRGFQLYAPHLWCLVGRPSTQRGANGRLQRWTSRRGRLCGGEECLRDTMNIESGTRVEIGCHHAEMNLICNAAANGVPTNNAWLIVWGEPCMMCAKLIHHAGIERAVIVDGGFMGENGVGYLENHGVEIQRTEGPCRPDRALRPEQLTVGLWLLSLGK